MAAAMAAEVDSRFPNDGEWRDECPIRTCPIEGVHFNPDTYDFFLKHVRKLYVGKGLKKVKLTHNQISMVCKSCSKEAG